MLIKNQLQLISPRFVIQQAAKSSVPLAPRVRGSAGTPPPPPARGRSHPVGFRRADVGGSKRLPAPYKAVWAARAGDRAARAGELRRAGERRPREPGQPPAA